MDNRREQRAMVDWELIEPPRLLGFRVRVWIGSADKPEHGWRVPFGSERSKVLARWRCSGVPDAVGGKVSAERVDDTRTRLRVIHIQGISVQCRYLGRPRRAGRRRLGIYDAFNGRKHTFANALLERSDTLLY